MIVTILTGLPGSGKSTFARNKCEGSLIVSADYFFVTFDPNLLDDAHGWCLRRFIKFCSSVDFDLHQNLVVDNTNTRIEEIAPYYQVAQAYGREVGIVTIRSNLTDAELAKRNVHGVPERVIARMREQMVQRDRLMPDRWHHRYEVAP